MNNSLNGKLGSLVAAGGGKIHTGPFGSQLHASDYVPKGIPCIMPANMKNSRVDLSDIAFITELDAKRLSKYIVKENDIVYSRRGDVTQKALIRKHEEGYFCGTGCLLLRPGKKFDARFLTYYLSTQKIQNWIVSQAVGATMPNLNTGILFSIHFDGPEKAEQERVANVLSAIEDKIELNNRINAELEAMAKILFDYWFVQFDFPDDSPQGQGKPYKTSGGKMVYNPTLKREIPEGWEVLAVGNYADVKKGTLITEKDANQDGNIKVVSAGLNYSYFHDKANYPANVITISASGASAGFVNFWREPIFACDCTVVKGRSDEETIYLLNFLKMRQEFIYQQARGSAQPHVYPKDISGLYIEVPPNELLKKFGVNVLAGNTEISNRLQQNEKLAQLRDWLLPMLMNGQVTVGEAS